MFKDKSPKSAQSMEPWWGSNRITEANKVLESYYAALHRPPPTLWGLDHPSTSKRLLAKILHANLTLGRDYKPRFKVWSSQGNIMGNLYTYDTHFILKLVTSVIRSKLSKLGSYIKSWEAGGIINRRIGLWIVWSYIIWEKK